MGRKRRVRIWTGLFLVALAAAGGLWYVNRRLPVFYAFHPPGAPQEQPAWCIWNPLRDKAPEEAGEEVLRQLRSGQQQDLLESLQRYGPGNLTKEVIANEEDHRIREWTFVARTDTGGRATLFYRVLRADSGVETPVWLTMKQIDGRWCVVDFANGRS